MRRLKNIRRITIYFLFAIILACAATSFNIGSKTANGLSAVPSTTTVQEPLYDFDSSCYTQSVLNELAVQILNSGSNKTINDLINYATNTAGTAGLPITRKNLTLKYGRYRYTPESGDNYRDLVWMPVYLSRSRTGDAILTLYLASVTLDSSYSQMETAQFTNYGTYTSDQSCNAPSNMYGMSAMSAITLGNGGSYAYYPNPNTSQSTTYTATIEASKCNKFSDFVQGTDFIGELYEDIVTPSDIYWQETESYADVNYFTGNTYCWPNEAYGTPSDGTYYMPGYFDYNETGKVNYNSWSEDKVWLPSVTEVGFGDIDGDNTDTTNGIWRLTMAQRSCPTGTKSWLRTAKTDIAKSGYNYSTYTMFCIDSDGNITSGDVNETLAVRPAIHLNLSAIAKKTIPAIKVPDVVSTVYNGEVLDINSVDPANRTWYSADIMTISFFMDEEKRIMVPPQDAGTYYMLIQLKNTTRPFYGQDPDDPEYGMKTVKFVVEKLKMEVAFEYDVDDPTLPIRAYIVDEENVIKPRDKGSAGNMPVIGMKYINTGGIVLDNPYEFPNIKGTYWTVAYIIDENIYNYNYEIAKDANGDDIRSTQFRVLERNVPEPYFIADALDPNESINEAGTELRLKYKGKRYIQIANISPYVKIEVTALKTGAMDRVVDCILRDDGVQVFSVEDCTSYTFTVTLKDTINTQWASSQETGLKDTIPKTLMVHVDKADLSIKFDDSLPSSWENAREMSFRVEVLGLYENLGESVDINVAYQRAGTVAQYLTADSTGLYTIPAGLTVAEYTLAVTIADTGNYTSNYTLANAATRKFTIVATVAQFENNEALWHYMENGSTSSSSSNYQYNQYDSPTNYLTLRYGPAYTFHLTVTAPIDQLYSRYLKAVYTGDTYAQDAGLHSVTVTIMPRDKYVQFTEKKYTIYFFIEQSVFDLSGIQWDYSSPFTYTGSEHKVMLDPATPLPTGLTVTYVTSGLTNVNTAINVGTYKTEAVFTVSEEYATNFKVPQKYDSDTYLGTFSFECNWEIKPQEIEVKWNENDSTTNIFFIPTLQVGHALVDYVYERSENGSWVSCDSVTAPTGAAVNYRVKPVLKAAYADSYTLSSDAWYSFTLLSGKTPVSISFKANGSACENGVQYVYDGSAVQITPVVNETDVNVTNYTVTYYSVNSSGNKGAPLDSAPVNAGKYIAEFSVTFDNGYLADGANNSVTFEIAKADFDMSSVKWQYTHGGVTITAGYDVDQKKWVNENGEEVVFSFEYDGTQHKLELIGVDSVEGLSLNNLYDDGYINAGTYSSGVSFSYDSVNYNSPTAAANELFPASISWKIEKAKIHFENVKWGYADDEGNEYEFENDDYTFEFTRDENGLVYYTVKLINLPKTVSDSIVYTTKNLINVGTTTTGERRNRYAGIGVYETQQSNYINYAGDANHEGYTGSFPGTIPTYCSWEIVSRDLTVPAYDGSWTTFDSEVHNLVDMCGVTEEDLYYYNVKIQFVDNYYMIYEDYPGYAENNGEPVRYTAYHAGNYLVRFYELRGEAEEEVLATQIEIVIDKAKLVVTWDMNGSIPVARMSGVYVTDMLDTIYTNENGGVVTRDYVLTTTGLKFYAQPGITANYTNNIRYEMKDGEEEIIAFTSYRYTPTPGVSHEVSRPAFENNGKLEYTGSPITFKIGSWDALYAPYLYITGDDLTQTNVGKYKISIDFKNEADAYWAGTDGNRSSYELEFEITIPQNVPIDYPDFNRLFADVSGNMEEFTITNWIALQQYIYYEIGDLVEVRSGVLGQVSAGIYVVKFKFIEGSYAYWKLSGTQDEYEVTITLSGGDEKVIAKPSFANPTVDYTGSAIGFALINPTYYDRYLEIISGSNIATNPGTYKVVYGIKAGLDVTFTDGSTTIELTYTINAPTDPTLEVPLQKPSLEEISKQYTGQPITFTINNWESLSIFLEITSGSLTKTDVGTYTVTIGFKSGSNAKWEDGSRDPYEITFYITNPPAPNIIEYDVPTLEEEEKEFTGNDITFVINNFIDDMERYVLIKDVGFAGLVRRDVGEYTITLQIKSEFLDTVRWSDGTTRDVELTFRITPAIVDGSNITAGEDGKIHGTNGDGSDINFDDFLEYVYKDKDGNIVSPEDFKDGEEYTATVKVKDDKLEEFENTFENASELIKDLENRSYSFVYKSNSGGITPILIITIAVVGVLVFLVVATIVVLAVKRRQYLDDDAYYDDYEEDDD